MEGQKLFATLVGSLLLCDAIWLMKGLTQADATASLAGGSNPSASILSPSACMSVRILRLSPWGQFIYSFDLTSHK